MKSGLDLCAPGPSSAIDWSNPVFAFTRERQERLSVATSVRVNLSPSLDIAIQFVT